jgi:hypothetical protein
VKRHAPASLREPDALARRRAVEITCQRDKCDDRRRYHVLCTQDFFEKTASTPGAGRWIGPHDLQHLRLAGAAPPRRDLSRTVGLRADAERARCRPQVFVACTWTPALVESRAAKS